MSLPDHFKRSLPFFKLGRDISAFHFALFPDPFETKSVKEPAADILHRIEKETLKLRGAIAAHPSMAMFHKLIGLGHRQFPQKEIVQVLSYLLHCEYNCNQGEQTTDALSFRMGTLFGETPEAVIEGRLTARSWLAVMLEKGLLVMDQQGIHTCPQIAHWVTNGNLLMSNNLSESMVESHLAKQKPAEPKPVEQPQQLASEIFTPQLLFDKLKEVVIGQDHACRVLATRGWLHLKRAELLKKGEKVGTNECLFFISQHSGVGKTFMAENYGRLCSLPFASFSSTDATSVGYVGLDLVEDSIRSLIRAAGGAGEAIALEKARLGGILFFDEWTKKRASPSDSGRDINAVGVQNEILRLMEGCKVVLGNRRVDRDSAPVVFDSSGLMFVFGGFVADFDKIIGKQRGCTIGFGDNRRRGHGDAYISDALIDIGFIPEFVNRLSKVVVFKKLTTDDLVAIATSRRGVLNAYRYLLKSSGLSFRVEDAALRYMANISAETGMMARGLRLIIGSLVEDLVFSGAKGEVVLSLKEVEEAVGRVMSVNAASAVNASNSNSSSSADSPEVVNVSVEMGGCHANL